MTFDIPLDFLSGLTATSSAHMTNAVASGGFDLHSLIGLSGMSFVESVVQYFKEQWGMPSKMAPVAGVVVGLVTNILLALTLKNDLVSAVYVGLATGFFSSVWHEVKS